MWALTGAVSSWKAATRSRHVRRDLLLVDEIRSGGSVDKVYRGDEPADAPPERPAASLQASRREDRGQPS